MQLITSNREPGRDTVIDRHSVQMIDWNSASHTDHHSHSSHIQPTQYSDKESRATCDTYSSDKFQNTTLRRLQSKQYSLNIQSDVSRARQYSEQYSLTIQGAIPRAKQYSYTALVLGIVKALVECLRKNISNCSVAYLNQNSL